MHTKQYYLLTKMHAYLRACGDTLESVAIREGYRMRLEMKGKNETKKGSCLY